MHAGQYSQPYSQAMLHPATSTLASCFYHSLGKLICHTVGKRRGRSRHETDYVTVVNYREQPRWRENGDYCCPRNALAERERQSEERDRRLPIVIKSKRRASEPVFGEAHARSQTIRTTRSTTETETESKISADQETADVTAATWAGSHDNDRLDRPAISCSCRRKNFRAVEVRLFFYLFVIKSHFYRAMLCMRGTSHGFVSVCPPITTRCSTKKAKRIIT